MTMTSVAASTPEAAADTNAPETESNIGENQSTKVSDREESLLKDLEAAHARIAHLETRIKTLERQNEPTVLDVLCGRGGTTNAHEGNKRFRTVVAEHQEEYLTAKKKEKAIMAHKIVKIINGRGGRFLGKNDSNGSWEPVDEKKAIEKTSQALREGLDVRSKQQVVQATAKTTSPASRKTSEARNKSPKAATEKGVTEEKEATEEKKTTEKDNAPKPTVQLLEDLAVRNRPLKHARANSDDEAYPNKLPKVTTWTEYENRLRSL
jgi:hypothetical protein